MDRNYCFSTLCYFFSYFRRIKIHCYWINIGKNNFYPIDFILISTHSLICGLKTNVLMSAIPPFFTFLFIPSVFLLAKQIFKKRMEVMLALLLGSILLFSGVHFSFSPNAQAFLLLPFLLYLFFKSRKGKQLSFAILFVILLILFGFFHPLAMLLLILLFIIFEFSRCIYGIVSNRYSSSFSESMKVKSTRMIILLSSVVFIGWYTFFYSIIRNFKTIFNSFVYTYFQKIIIQNKIMSRQNQIGFFCSNLIVTQ